MYLICACAILFNLPTWILVCLAYNPKPEITSRWSAPDAIIERFTQDWVHLGRMRRVKRVFVMPCWKLLKYKSQQYDKNVSSLTSSMSISRGDCPRYTHDCSRVPRSIRNQPSGAGLQLYLGISTGICRSQSANGCCCTWHSTRETFGEKKIPRSSSRSQFPHGARISL